MGLMVFIFIVFFIVWIVNVNSRFQKMQDELRHDLAYILTTMTGIDKQICSIWKIVGKDIPEEPEDEKEQPVELPQSMEKFEEVPQEKEEPEPVTPERPEVIEEIKEIKVRQKTKFESSVGEILSKIWSWILVGEDYRPKNVSMEYAVASTWLMRLGIMALVICIGYFLKWTIDRGVLGPEGRVTFSVLAGLGMLTLGIKNLQKKYHILAQGFLGGGLAALYFSIYAAGPMYKMISLPASFILMVLVTIVAGVLALKSNSQLIAIFSIIGGFCTPIILQGPGAGLGVLYSYMLLLSLGILGIAHAKNWRLLNYLGFIFTWMLFFKSLFAYVPGRDFSTAMVFLTLLFVLHSVIVYYYNLIKRKKSTSLEIVHLLVNAFLYAVTSYGLIVRAHGRPWPAVMAIGLAVFYIMHVFVFLKNRLNDRNLLISLIGLAGFFTAWAIPLIAQKETLTICWSLQAFLFLWIGLKLNSNLLVTFSSVLYFLVMGRLVFFDMPGKFAHFDWHNFPMRDYWKVFFDRVWTFGIVIASFFGSFALHGRKIRQISDLAVEDKNNTGSLMSNSAFREIMFWCGVLFLFLFSYFEFFQMFSFYLPLQMPVLTLLWCGLGVYLIYNFTSRDGKVFLAVSMVIGLIILFKLFIFDFNTWGFAPALHVYGPGIIDMWMRFFDYGLVFFFLMALMKATHKKDDLINFSKVFTVAGTVLLFIYVSLETNTFFYHYVPAFQAGSVSVVWALFAIAYLIIGIRKLSKGWRYSGLILFLVVVCKVFFSDLSDMEVLHRVIAFMILGILLIGGSFSYIKANKKFEIEEDS